MAMEDKTKRAFFKKVAATVGFVSSAGYLSNLMSGRANSIQAINNFSAHEVNKQKRAWLQKQWVPMSEREKKQMLDKILDIHNKSEA